MKKYMSYKHGKVIDVDTYVTLDTGDEQFVGIGLRVLNEVWGSLLRGDGNERHTLVGRLEPDNLRSFDWPTPQFLSAVAFTFPALSLLLFFRGSRGWTQETKRARE